MQINADNRMMTERHFTVSPAKLWRALTDAALLGEWLFPTDFQATVGHHFTFQAPPQPNWDGRATGKVLEVISMQRLRFTWASGDLQTVVTMDLTKTDKGTRLTVLQTGFRTDQGPNLAGATAAWQRFLDNLARCLAAHNLDDRMTS